MTLYVPGIMFGAGVSLYLFYEFNRTRQARLDERRENLQETRQEYLHRLIEAKRKAEIKNEPPSGGADGGGGEPAG
jgi:hypothetical protein